MAKRAVRFGKASRQEGGHIRNVNGWRIGGVFCRTRECAEYISDVMVRYPNIGSDERFRLIGRALETEGHPLTCYPPRGAGDVIGEAA